MIEQLIRLIQVEWVDDIPLLLAQRERMQVAALLDQHFPTHGPWAGELTFGEVAVVWLACSLKESIASTIWRPGPCNACRCSPSASANRVRLGL